MAEDRFANVFTASVVMSAANVLTFAELNFGITLRDRIAIVIDELYFYPSFAALAEMTATGDRISWGITISDQVADINVLSDRRIMYNQSIFRLDAGTAASAVIKQRPFKESFSPPIIVLPNRMFFGSSSAGLTSAATTQMRMHYRTVKISSDDQLIEVLETLQLQN